MTTEEERLRDLAGKNSHTARWAVAEIDRLRLRLAWVEAAIGDYHLALDNQEHGGIAEGRAFDCIQEVLGMHWEQGAEKARRTTKGQS